MKQVPHQLFINGKWTNGTSGKTIRQINPATEQLVSEVQSASTSDIGTAIDGAQSAFEAQWRDLAPRKRAEILFAIARRIRESLEDLAQLECANIGKPISDARDEIGLGANVFEYYAGAVSKFYGHTIPVGRGGFDFTLRQPMGVVAAIVPWNFPFPIACWKVAPALAAGNSVVLKPASLSTLTALRLGGIGSECGLPPGTLQVVPGSGAEVGDALVSHPSIRKISFTGSTEIGSRILALTAHEIKRTSLELGGKSPNIVFADAEWHKAADTSPMSVFANTGQDCCARSRMFVAREIFEPFVERFLTATRALKVGDPTDPETQIGPMVSAGQRESVEGFLNDARTDQSIKIHGGGRSESKGYYLSPAVLTGVNLEAKCWKEEIFGPVVCIRPFDDEESMLREVNASPYGLSGSIWTNDLRRALRVARKVESGVLSINSHSSVHTEAPFGGFKQSGLGRDLGMAAMEGYTELKNVYIAE